MIFAQIIKKGWRPFMNTILANFFNDFKERFESLFDSLEMPDPENHDAFRLWSMKLLGKDRSLSIDYLEEQIKTIISQSSTSILAMFLAMIDRSIHDAKADRKALNMVVERANDQRSLLLSFGALQFQRTYYKCTGTDGPSYSYPVDQILGLDPFQKVSNGISNDLVNASITMSFQKASENVTGGAVSKQTVMNKVRESTPLEIPESPVKKVVTALHIDADEDHIHRQMKGEVPKDTSKKINKSAVVPVTTVYEGINHHGKRGICINAFSVSRYGCSADNIWEETLCEIEKRYDISNAVVYIHGDGAPWIRTGLTWFPKARFVLDDYHKNKYVKKTFSGIPKNESDPLQKKLREILNAGTKEDLLCLQGDLVAKYPHRVETIMEGTGYLYNNFDGIQIRKADEEARNGGASEPHVSHILSSRLSSRPKGWSDQTLKAFVPILAKGMAIYGNAHVFNADKAETDAKAKQSNSTKGKKHPYSRVLGLPDPSISVSIPTQGKVNSLFNALRPFFGKQNIFLKNPTNT